LTCYHYILKELSVSGKKHDLDKQMMPKLWISIEEKTVVIKRSKKCLLETTVNETIVFIIYLINSLASSKETSHL